MEPSSSRLRGQTSHRGGATALMTRASTWRQAFRSLQFKASLLIVVLALLVTGSGVAVGLRATTSAYYDNELARTRQWAVSVAAAVAPLLASPDHQALSRIASDLIQSHGVAYAAFTDRSGMVLASAEESPELLAALHLSGNPNAAPVFLARPRDGRQGASPVPFANVLVPIRTPASQGATGTGMSSVIGHLHLARDISNTQVRLQAIANHLWRLALGVVLLVVPCSLLVTRKVVSPLEELAKTARVIAAGSVDARVPVSSQDEIGQLARSFNEMADRLVASQIELIQVNTQLEQRVQQRTRELQELASRDPLTGLYNRRYFAEEMVRAFAVAQRYDSDLTCLMFDLDHFKQINDRLGHRVGDEVLILLAKAIASQLRGSDVAARFGGDEFTLLLPQTSSSAAVTLADRVVNTFTGEVCRELPAVPATLSIGVASLRTAQAPSAEALIQQADLAMYAAKQAGRNCTVTAGGVATRDAGVATRDA